MKRISSERAVYFKITFSEGQSKISFVLSIASSENLEKYMHKMKVKINSYTLVREAAGVCLDWDPSNWESFQAWGTDLEDGRYDLGN